MNWQTHFNCIPRCKQEAIVARYHGETLEELALDLGISMATLHNYANKLGIRRKRKSEPNKALIRFEDGTGRCKKCLKTQDLSQFGNRRAVCKTCVKERALANSKRSFERYWRRRFITLRTRARKCAIPFDLEAGDLVSLWQRQRGLCFYTDVPMVWEDGKSRRTLATVDKLEVAKGYIKGNVVLCTWLANSVKTDLTLEEMELWVPGWHRRIVQRERLNVN